MSNITRADLWAAGVQGPFTVERVNVRMDAVKDSNGYIFGWYTRPTPQFVCDALNAAWDALPEDSTTRNKEQKHASS